MHYLLNDPRIGHALPMLYIFQFDHEVPNYTLDDVVCIQFNYSEYYPLSETVIESEVPTAVVQLQKTNRIHYYQYVFSAF